MIPGAIIGLVVGVVVVLVKNYKKKKAQKDSDILDNDKF